MSFINQIFLFATAAAVLPVLYHLVRRMKARTVPFSSLMFLKATPKELIKKRRLRDRLLMAARCAIFLLLALVFARPYLPAERLPFVAGEESESTVILVDRSFSMQHGGAFERALDAVREQLDAAGAGDEIAVVAFDESPRLLAPLEADLTVHRGAIDALSPSHRTTDYFPALQRAQDLLKDARHDRRAVVLISDFQATGWTGALDNWKLGPGIAFVPVAVGAREPANGYVEAVQVSARRSGERYVMRYDARIGMTGEVRRREASFVVGSAEVERRVLSARASAPVSFQHVPERNGFLQGRLALDQDEMPIDDSYYFTEEVAAEPGLLIVDSGTPAARRDAFYLRSAFELGEASRYRVEAADRLAESQLQRHDVVFFANRAATQPGERQALRRYVEDGGTLIISMGEAATASATTAILQELEVGRVSTIVDARDDYGYQAIVGEVDVRHPIFAPFGANGSLLQPKFRRYARLEPSNGTNVIGRFDSGDPFVAERALGRGLVLFYASTFNTSWTDMPLDEMYVPFVYQLAGYGTGRRDAHHVFTVGEPVAFVGEPGNAWEIRAPRDRIYRVTVEDDGRGHFRETDVPGHYTAVSGPRTRMFSVNVDPRESDLTARDPEEVYAAVVAPTESEPRTPEQAAAAILADDEQKQKLWRLLLLVVIGLFAVETYFAHRRAHGGEKRGVDERRPDGGAKRDVEARHPDGGGKRDVAGRRAHGGGRREEGVFKIG